MSDKVDGKGAAESTSSPAFFIVLRLSPILASLILGMTNSSVALSALAVLVLGLLDFYLTKSHFGLGLVGLRWFVDRSESPNFPFLAYYSRPFPFVATTFDSNVFWVTLLLSAVLDALALVVLAAARGWRWGLISVALLFLTLLNISGFIRCHNIAKMTADKAARSLLLDTSVTFQAANEVVHSESESDDEEAKPEAAAPQAHEASDDIE
jgi:hypothetical protein